MRTNELIKEIKSLPLSQRIYVIEKAIHSVREQEEKNKLKKLSIFFLMTIITMKSSLLLQT